MLIGPDWLRPIRTRRHRSATTHLGEGDGGRITHEFRLISDRRSSAHSNRCCRDDILGAGRLGNGDTGAQPQTAQLLLEHNLKVCRRASRFGLQLLHEG